MSPPLLHDYLAATAASRGRDTALVFGDERVTFAELEALSNQLADALIDAGCSPGDRVCLLAPKAPVTIAAMLGTLKAGCAYVPLDLASPSPRSARIVEATEPAAVFLAPEAEPLAAELRGVGALGDSVATVTAADAGGRSDRPHPRRAAPGDPAHILFTSGSTGRPKGVVVTHASVSRFVEWAVAYFGIAPGERLSALPPLHFDLSTFDLYGAIRAGAELHLPPVSPILPGQLARYIAHAELHQLFCVPSALTYVLAHGALPEAGFSSLHRILWCGEVLPTPVLIEWMRRHPRAVFTNLYGPTETTIASTYHTVAAMPPDPHEPVPIGIACDGEEVLVLDDALEPVLTGEVGELCVAGAGVSPGYWRAPELTARAFVADPRPGHEGERIYRTGDYGRRDTAGVLHFLGRRDTQVKSRGHRIELGEIEAAVSALPEVGECAVVGMATEGFEGVAICCAVAARSDPPPTAVELRSRLSQMLPGYMLPSRWQVLEELPKNGNGKIDRGLVLERFTRTPAGGAAS